MATVTFKDFGAFASHFAKSAAVAKPVIEAHVAEVTFSYFEEVLSVFGSKRRLLPLAPGTIARRVKRGGNIGSPDRPLVYTGELRASVKYFVRGYIGAVGTDDERMVWHELGTSRVPPRPVFRIALANTKLKMIVMSSRVLPIILGTMKA